MRNCLSYALSRLFAEGGSIIIRRSRIRRMFPRPRWHPVNWIPHFLHRSRQLVITQYVPTREQMARHYRMGLWLAWLDLWRFDGEIIGDDKVGGMMEVLLSRNDDPNDDQNFGVLYIDGVVFCDTLEDKDRRLEDGGIKVMGSTAIPRGRYRLTVDYSQKFGKMMIHVLDVPQFVGVRIHGGVDEEDTEGCPLVGMRNSRVLMFGLRYSRDVTAIVHAAIIRGEEAWLTVR